MEGHRAEPLCPVAVHIHVADNPSSQQCEEMGHSAIAGQAGLHDSRGGRWLSRGDAVEAGMSTFHLALFGPLALSIDGRAIPLRCAHARALLALLALQPRHSQRRDAVMDALWRDAPLEWCRKQLRQTLWRLRTDTADWCSDAAPLICADGELLALNPIHALATDVGHIEQMITALQAHPRDMQVLMQAEALVEAARGSVLDGDDHDWCLIERERCENRLLLLLQLLSDAFAALGDPQRALRWRQRLIEINPLHEPSHRRLIELQLALGDRPAAARQLEQCTRILRHELGVQPDAETRLAAHSVDASLQLAQLHTLCGQLGALYRRMQDELNALEQRLR
jgi:DNA-binding SARP family transcriptional activator